MTINKQKTTEAVDFEQVDINPTPTFTVDQCESKPGSFTNFRGEDPFTGEPKVAGTWTNTILVCRNVFICNANRDGDLISIQVTAEADPSKLKDSDGKFLVPVTTYDLRVRSFPSLEKAYKEDTAHELRTALRANVEFYDSGKGVLVNLHRFIPYKGWVPENGKWFGKITLANGSVDAPADKKLAGI